MTTLSRPLVLLCGAPGTGKSTEGLSAFSDSLYITSSPNNPHFFKKLVKGGKISARAPRKIKLIDTYQVGTSTEDYSFDVKSRSTRDTDGNLVAIKQSKELESTIWAVLKKSIEANDKGEAPPYKNIILDETGTFWSRVFAEKLPECVSSGGKVDTRKAFAEVGEWSAVITNWLRQVTQCGVGVCLIMHDREPEGEKKGGPRLPSQTIAAQLCADADGVLQRVMQDPTVGELGSDGKPARAKRLWVATAGQTWHRKLRGLEEEDEPLIATMKLEDILTLAGWDM